MVMMLGAAISYWHVMHASSHCHAPKKLVMAQHTGMLRCKFHLQSAAERGMTYRIGDVDEDRRTTH